MNAAEQKAEITTALTIGKFDGFHLGHRILLDDIINESRSKGYRAICLKIKTDEDSIFTEIDDEFFFYNFLEEADISLDYLNLEDICTMTAEEFVRDILVYKYNVKYISVGQDFRFGAKRSGDVSILQQLGEKYGFECNIHEKLSQGGEIVSSSLIRKYLSEGRINKANELLGRNYSILGDVEPGLQLGRTFGYPTINVGYEHNRLLPRFGVYSSNVYIFHEGGTPELYRGVTNIGIRPSIDDGEVPTVETFMLDYSGEEIYAKRVLLELEHFIRPEMRFDSIDELTKQIALDIESVKTRL